jgi:hypothetical protein
VALKCIEPILIEIVEQNKYIGNFELKAMLKNPEAELYKFFKDKSKNMEEVVTMKTKNVSIKVKDNYLEERTPTYIQEVSLTRILADNHQFFIQIFDKKTGISYEKYIYENVTYENTFRGKSLVDWILNYEIERGFNYSRYI